MLPGIMVRPLKKNFDERGSFSELLRSDWKELLGDDRIVQANVSITYPGVVRAWHRHERGQVDYFVVLKGALKICAFDEETKELFETFSTGECLQVVRVPGFYWHGFKALGCEPVMLLYFVNRLYDYDRPDEVRRPWNDTIVPVRINGRDDDPRVGKPWDWLAPPHK